MITETKPDARIDEVMRLIQAYAKLCMHAHYPGISDHRKVLRQRVVDAIRALNETDG